MNGKLVTPVSNLINNARFNNQGERDDTHNTPL